MFRTSAMTILFWGLAFSASGVASGQIGRNTTLWQWSGDSPHHQAIVQVSSGGGFGCGVIVHVDRDRPVADGYEGWCLTAWHVVSGDNQRREIGVTYANGRTARECKVLARDEDNDVAVVWVWVPPEIVPVALAVVPVNNGDYLEFAGLGGGSELACCLRHFSSRAAMTTNRNTLFADAALLPGDSGGPVFDKDGHLTGVISGGWFWWDGGVTMSDGTTIKATWPARACNLGPINDVLGQARLAIR